MAAFLWVMGYPVHHLVLYPAFVFLGSSDAVTFLHVSINKQSHCSKLQYEIIERIMWLTLLVDGYLLQVFARRSWDCPVRMTAFGKAGLLA